VAEGYQMIRERHWKERLGIPLPTIQRETTTGDLVLFRVTLIGQQPTSS
jgi:hypothetical protein